jgi:hypothetical protein
MMSGVGRAAHTEETDSKLWSANMERRNETELSDMHRVTSSGQTCPFELWKYAEGRGKMGFGVLL